MIAKHLKSLKDGIKNLGGVEYGKREIREFRKIN